MKQVSVLINPASGSANPLAVRAAVEKAFKPNHWRVTVHELKKTDTIAAFVQGVDLAIACGGDGTVSLVADALVGTSTMLGIIPGGTANVLAHELSIPFDPVSACQLYAGRHQVRVIDAMKVGKRHYFLDISIGVKSLAINDTKRATKKRFGMLAYLWNGARWLIKMHRRSYRLTVDGHAHDIKASEVDVANGSIMGQALFTYGDHVHPDDGVINLCIVRTARIEKYAQVFLHALRVVPARSPDVVYYDASRAISIETDRPIPVQADGEMIGTTPVDLIVVPHAVRFITG